MRSKNKDSPKSIVDIKGDHKDEYLYFGIVDLRVSESRIQQLVRVLTV